MISDAFILFGFFIVSMVMSWLGWKSPFFHIVPPLYGALGYWMFMHKPATGVEYDRLLGSMLVYYVATWLFVLDAKFNPWRKKE